jgi:excinuclease ABC subunit A
MILNKIKVYGAKEHNLKNINIEIPKNKLVVITGISGSGKSSLAFSTLYAEGQRRYLESLSSYARQFLDKVGKPRVDKIEGLTPAISIDQKTTSKNPRSTVGTITEIYDYIRLLYARVGTQHCHKCNQPISSMSDSDVIEEVMSLPQSSKAILMAPIVKDKRGSFADILEILKSKGYVRVIIDGHTHRLDDEIELKKTTKHTIKIVVDRVVINQENKDRISLGVEKALKESFGELEIEIANHEEVGMPKALIHYSKHLACHPCKVSFEPLEPVSFSFNSHKGACPSCNGLGIKYTINFDKIIDENLSISNGAIRLFFGFNKSYYHKYLMAFCDTVGINTSVIYDELSDIDKAKVLNGSPEQISFFWKKHKLKRVWMGVVSMAYDMLKDDKELKEYMIEKICDECNGHRLKQEHMAVRIANKNIPDLMSISIEDIYAFFKNKKNFSYLDKNKTKISASIFKEIRERLQFLYSVGLDYLTLGRDARTISGGEAQRIRISSQIGSGLTGVMYVLDEPSIGLHERDTLKLIDTLKNLRDKGNSIIVVEHDKETILNADYVIDIGPKAGKHGGRVVFSGDLKKLATAKTLTADYLYNRKQIIFPTHRKADTFLEINNVNINNIKNLSTKIPLQNFVSITGVSGSGKSSLILQTLLPVAKEILNHARKVNKVKGVEIIGMEHLDKVIYLDQSPIGRTPRSNPATYTGIMDEIRDLFSKTQESALRGYKPGRFSFNVKGGRCEKCQGDGDIKIEMHFLPDVMVKCDECNGSRYNKQTLEILYKTKNISDILNMSIKEASLFFKAFPKISAKLKTLMDTGLDYITLGQNATTLSGGEAQRIKLSKELSKKDTGKTLYILDEPTTGLHFDDINRLVKVLHSLVNFGNSVVVIEHNLDVIRNSDYIIDIGPEGGKGGGKVVACGTPKEIIKHTKKSYTAKFLKEELKLFK